MTELQALMTQIGDIVKYNNSWTWVTHVERHRTKGVLFRLEGYGHPVSYDEIMERTGENIYG